MSRRLFVLAATVCAGLGLADAATPEQKPAKSATNEKPSDSASMATGDGPLQIFSDSGMEMSKDAKLLIARGNAKAIRGNMTVTADTLIGHYRDKLVNGAPPPKDKTKEAGSDADPTGGGSEVWRVEAQDRVKIFSPSQTAYGDHADYNIDDAVVVLTGKDLRLITPTDVITAKDSMEYWDAKHQAVARGDAVATRRDKRIQADVLVADFAEDENKKMNIDVAHGYGHVILTTPQEVVTGDRSDYVVATGVATITGIVHMTHGNNQLDGCYAVVNMNTGISHLYPAPPGKTVDKACQVKGLLVPQKNQNQAVPTAAPAPKAP